MLDRLIRYISTPIGQGVGTGNLAYLPRFVFPSQSVYNEAYMVRGQLNPTAPAYFKRTQNIPTVPIEGNGLALAGQVALQMLIQEERGKEK